MIHPGFYLTEEEYIEEYHTVKWQSKPPGELLTIEEHMMCHYVQINGEEMPSDIDYESPEYNARFNCASEYMLTSQPLCPWCFNDTLFDMDYGVLRTCSRCLRARMRTELHRARLAVERGYLTEPLASPPTRLELEERARFNAEYYGPNRSRNANLGIDPLAISRAKRLLFSVLGPEEARIFNEHGYIPVLLPNKPYVYRIYPGRSGNVRLADVSGVETHKFCIHEADPVPQEDTMLAQYLLLHTDEDMFLRTANRSAIMCIPQYVAAENRQPTYEELVELTRAAQATRDEQIAGAIASGIN